MDRYSLIKYKVHNEKGPLIRAFPELFKDPAMLRLNLRPESDKIVRYIIFLYDKNSALIQEFQSDLTARKEAAAFDAGFRKEKGAWPYFLMEIMEVRDKEAVESIMAYLKLQKHQIWKEIVITEQELHEFQTLRFSKIDADEDKDILSAAEKKEKLLKACSTRLTHLEALYEQFYGDNKDVQAAEFEEMITPETAERIMDTAPYEEIKISTNVLSN